MNDPLKVRAPFTPEQVGSLNAYQASGRFHEFTCGTNACGTVLTARADGWHCSRCGYTQLWAHTWMADWTWEEMA